MGDTGNGHGAADHGKGNGIDQALVKGLSQEQEKEQSDSKGGCRQNNPGRGQCRLDNRLSVAGQPQIQGRFQNDQNEPDYAKELQDLVDIGDGKPHPPADPLNDNPHRNEQQHRRKTGPLGGHIKEIGEYNQQAQRDENRIGHHPLKIVLCWMPCISLLCAFEPGPAGLISNPVASSHAAVSFRVNLDHGFALSPSLHLGMFDWALKETILRGILDW